LITCRPSLDGSRKLTVRCIHTSRGKKVPTRSLRLTIQLSLGAEKVQVAASWPVRKSRRWARAACWRACTSSASKSTRAAAWCGTDVINVRCSMQCIHPGLLPKQAQAFPSLKKYLLPIVATRPRTSNP
jgi:hypothetical protein